MKKHLKNLSWIATSIALVFYLKILMGAMLTCYF